MLELTAQFHAEIISIFAPVNAMVPLSARITITSEAFDQCAFPQLSAIAPLPCW
jgi:hypothetical protein